MSIEVKLQFVNGPRKGVAITIPALGLCVGREEDNDLVVSDGEMSRYHARIENRNDGWYACDLQSKNGIRVNGRLVKESVRLNNRDEVTIGGTIFVFRDDGGLPPPSASPASTVPAAIIRSVTDRVTVLDRPEPVFGASPDPLVFDEEKADEPAKAEPRFSKERIRRMALAGMLGLMIVVCAIVVAPSPKKTPPKPANHTGSTENTDGTDQPAVAPIDLNAYYLELQIRNDTLFRYELEIRKQKITVTVDDAASDFGLSRQGEIDPDLFQELKDRLFDTGFLDEGPVEPIRNDNQFSRFRMMVQSGNNGNYVEVINNVSPESFQAAKEILKDTARQVLGSAIPIQSRPRAEILQDAESKFQLAETRFAEREVAPSNLYYAMDLYEQVVTSLEGMNNRPTHYEASIKQLRTAKEMMKKSYDDHVFDIMQNANAQTVDRLQAALAAANAILREVPNAYHPYHVDARRKVVTLERAIERARRSKKKSWQ